MLAAAVVWTVAAVLAARLLVWAPRFLRKLVLLSRIPAPPEISLVGG